MKGKKHSNIETFVADFVTSTIQSISVCLRVAHISVKTHKMDIGNTKEIQWNQVHIVSSIEIDRPLTLRLQLELASHAIGEVRFIHLDLYGNCQVLLSKLFSVSSCLLLIR